MRVGRQVFCSALVFAALAGTALAAPAHWVASWAASQMIADPANALPPDQMTDSTLRQVIRLSIGGKELRLVLSNAFGTTPLHLKAVHLAAALPGGAIDPASDHPLTFDGRSDVTIPVGAAYVSDPLVMPVKAEADLAISIHYDTPPVVQTSHPGSRQTSYLVPGDHLTDAQLTGAKTVDHWYQIAAIEVLVEPKASAIVALGDSITDGRGSTTNGNDRWTNVLASQLQANPNARHFAVLNAGIGGNCVLRQCLGPNVLSRLEHEVFTPSGVSTVVVYEGVNDLGGLTREHPATPEEHSDLVARLIGGYQQIATRAHAHGMKAYIGTILPYGCNSYYHPDAANEADRAAVNGWIRSQKLFEGVVDFDAVLRDPSHPDRLNSAYDSGDCLHPSAAGYKVMGTVAAQVLAKASPVARKGRKK